MSTIGGTTLTAFALDEFLTCVYGILAVCALIALVGRWHSKVSLVRWYWKVLLVGMILRATKLGVPQFAFYRPFSSPPPVRSAQWWLLVGEWLVFVVGNACTTICYALILRMWHNALSIVAYGGQAPIWPQLAILHFITLCTATDAILTLMFAFVTPDTINVINAVKDSLAAFCIAISFIGYWWLLRKALYQIAQLGAGRMTSVSAETTIGQKALRKLRRITWVSFVCTIGALYRTASLLRFALLVTRAVPPGNTSDLGASVERSIYFILSDVLPAVSMLLVMMKCAPRMAPVAAPSARLVSFSRKPPEGFIRLN
jgi:hypothetical protein